MMVLFERLLEAARSSLGRALAATNVAIVILVVAGISFAAIDIIHDLAQNQGRAQAQLAGAAAREELRRMTEDALTLARVLAERPTLQRLLREEQPRALMPFLKRFCETGGLDACAVLRGTEVIAQSGPILPWNEIVAASREQGERFIAAPATARLPVLGASAMLGDGLGTEVFALRLLDAQLARELSARAGVEVRLVNYRVYTTAPVNDFTSVHAAALADGRSAAQRIDSRKLYVASFPVFAVTGEAIALIEARQPAGELDAAAGKLVRRLLWSALILAVLGVLSGLMLGRLVTEPVRALTDAAKRLAQGDFSTSIPRGGTAEVASLAGTMDDMRRNLLESTTALRRREMEAHAMLGGISHEFRTPLAAQLASIELLREGLTTLSPEQQQELVLSLERGTVRLTQLIDNLLENVRIESGQLGIRKQTVLLADVVEDAHALIGSLLELRRQKLEVTLPEDLPGVSGDQPRLTQVLVNLLANASKFSPEGSTIYIGAAARDRQVTLWVEDEGPGIPPGVEGAAIFERFHRGSRQEPAQSGLGLGLWIAKSIVDRHGGSISVARTSENRTRFSVTLPAESSVEPRISA